MSREDLDNVLRLMERLTPEERASALSGLKAGQFLTLEKKASAGPDVSDDIVLQEIMGFMQMMNVDMSGAKQLAVGARYVTFKVKADVALAAFKKSKLNKTETRMMVRVGVSLLYADCVRMGWAVTSRTLMAHMHRMTAVIDREFPGYARLGALKLVTKGRNNVW